MSALSERGSTADALEDLRCAADLITEQHRISPDHCADQFWHGLAAIFRDAAESVGLSRSSGDWSRWNTIVKTARNYLDMGGVE